MIALRKMMIVNLLGRRFGFESYMELATPSTGRFYAEVDRDYFTHVARMMYVTPFALDDGLPVDFRSPDEDISGVLEAFRASGRRIDISLIDAWHTYPNAHRDLVQFFDLLPDGGVLVVHDCIPESREGASPRFRRGHWWGTTYKAFLDFVLQTPALDYVTLDCDHGCGLIIKNRTFDAVLGQDAPTPWLPPRPDADLVAEWLALKDFDAAYTLFETHHRTLLRLVPADRFLSLFTEAEVALADKRAAPTPAPVPPKAEPAPPPVVASPAAPPPPPPAPPPPAPPAPPTAKARASLDTRLMRFLLRQRAAMTGEIRGKASKGTSVRDPDKP